MSELPFTLSPEAAAHIERCLVTCESNPDCAALVPTLCCSLFSETQTDGVVTERFKGEHFGIGYYDPEEVESGEFIRLELCGRAVLVDEESLSRLAGKRLILETVEIGVPHPADKKTQLLRAV